jgi:hypothetical protein
MEGRKEGGREGRKMWYAYTLEYYSVIKENLQENGAPGVK